MADDCYRQDHPQRALPDGQQTQSSRQYPSSSDEPRASSDSSRASMAASVTLPSIHDTRAGGYGASTPLPGARGYGLDPRYASPNAVNGYPPPSGGQQPPGSYLPPMQPQQDARPSAYPPPDHRGPYYDDRRGAPPPPPSDAAYGQDAYYYRGPPGAPPPNGYPRPHIGPYGPDYGQSGNAASQMGQAAPRQRTSIACRYCRKRKIRCSGYQSAPGGKCQNCARMNQECIFQPVSSSSSTAFIPVSAVPGGVPPGTQLFGAYGQPLAPNSVPTPHHFPHGGGPSPVGAAGPTYYQPMQSPTGSYSSYGGDARADDPMAIRRRRRTPEEQEEGYRLPPPRNNMVDDDPREGSSHGSPGGIAHALYQGATSRHSPRNSTLTQLPTSANHGPPVAGGRSPVGQNGSSGASTPSHAQRPTQGATSSVMSLSNLVDKSDIDKGMIDRLNRPRDAKGSPP
ncbi:hypothetical protein E4U55_002267 [Claviceps digitariae]|nr:hypothetical protein E4U55_002267 [Claviceps digitariae]